MTRTMHRRELVEMLAAGLVVFTGIRPSGGRAEDPDLTSWITQELKGIDLSPIATAWRGLHPDESSEDRLATAILDQRRGTEPIGNYIARRVSAEYGAGQAEALDGWFLSPTEARLAVLIELTAGR
jgi:hypothetical protein